MGSGTPWTSTAGMLRLRLREWSSMSHPQQVSIFLPSPTLIARTDAFQIIGTSDRHWAFRERVA